MVEYGFNVCASSTGCGKVVSGTQGGRCQAGTRPGGVPTAAMRPRRAAAADCQAGGPLLPPAAPPRSPGAAAGAGSQEGAAPPPSPPCCIKYWPVRLLISGLSLLAHMIPANCQFLFTRSSQLAVHLATGYKAAEKYSFHQSVSLFHH